MPSKCKICIVISSLGPGGAERVMVKLAGLLAGSGFDVSILAMLSADAGVAPEIHPLVRIDKFAGEHYFSILRPFKKVFAEKKFRLIFGAVFTSLRNIYKTFSPLVSYIKKNSPDIIMTAHYNAPTIFAAKIAGTRSKIVITEHIILSSHFNSLPWLVKIFYSFSCRLFYPAADKIVAVSLSVAEDLRAARYAVPEKLLCIYNPSAVRRTENTGGGAPVHPWLPSTAQRPVFIAAGQLSKRKDYPCMLRALACLRKHADARLIVLGRGPLLPELKELAGELGIRESVDWLGFVPNPAAYMESAGYFVLSSLFEGLPTVVIEALSVGASVAVTDSVGGIREILGDSQWGRLAPVGDHEALADAMCEILKKPFNKNFLKARAEFFSEAKSLENYKTLIKNLLE